MRQAAERVEWVPIAKAETPTEAINLHILLNRTGVPFQTRGEFLHQLYGIAGLTIAGPVQFVVPAHLKEQAEASLHDIFALAHDIPQRCPACDSPTLRGRMDCPGCGLTLG